MARLSAVWAMGQSHSNLDKGLDPMKQISRSYGHARTDPNLNVFFKMNRSWIQFMMPKTVWLMKDMRHRPHLTKWSSWVCEEPRLAWSKEFSISVFKSKEDSS